MKMRCVTPMWIAKVGYIVMSLVFCGVGAAFILRPEPSMAVIGRALGIALVVFGGVKLVGYFSGDLFRLAFQYDLAFGILLIALGAVIRGSTSHYDYVCAEVSKGIAAVSLESGVPVLFGVLTTDTIEQAIERAGTKAGNKGADCAEAAIEMVNLIRVLE